MPRMPTLLIELLPSLSFPNLSFVPSSLWSNCHPLCRLLPPLQLRWQ